MNNGNNEKSLNYGEGLTQNQGTKVEINLFSTGVSLIFVVLSKPQPNLNTTVGLTMKMTLQTPSPTTTQTFQALLDELES